MWVFVPEGDTTNYNTFYKKGGGKNHPYTMKQTLKIKEGGWIPVYQQITGITTVSKYVVAWVLLGWVVLSLRTASTTSDSSP